MDIVDRDLEKAERAASPDRFPSPRGEQHNNMRRVETAASSVSTATTSSASIVREEMGMSRVQTQRDLERHPTALSRIHTQRSQHSATVGRSLKSRESRKPLPEFGGGKPYPPGLPEREEYVVEFDGPDDPLHAQNWPLKKKLFTAAILGFTTLVSAFTSSIFSAATLAVSQYFHVSSEVGTLGLSLYVLGFATGPILWAPLSELRGRRFPLVLSMFGFSIFQVAVATAKDLQTVLLCRFFGGLFGACPLAVVAAVFSDMFDNRTRGLAITVFSMTVFSGPLLAPFIGGFITESYLGWRWTEYIVAIMGFVCFGLDLFFLEETYPPVILIRKAAELRRRTRNWGIHAKQEEIEVDFRELLTKNFSRPLRILFTEPIVLLLSIYMSFIYGLLYLFLTAYPIVFQRIHGFSNGIGGLPYFGMILGQLLAGTMILLQQPSYNRKLAANNNIPIPEWRLPPVIIGGIAFTGGIFWFGWSGYRSDIHWIVPTLSGILTGFGLLSIFLQALNYIVDAYLMFAASAIAANTFLRSLAGAVFPLFAQYMFNALGVNWAGTLLGCVAAVLVPIPVAFYIYGGKIREKSKFAPTFPKPEETTESDHVNASIIRPLTVDSSPSAKTNIFLVQVRVTTTASQPIELCAIEDDASSAEAPLMQQESVEALDATGNGDLREADLTSPSWFIWALTFSAGISGLLFGYDTGVISSTLVSIGSDLSRRPLTTLDKSLITSCTSLFALLASPVASVLADKLGRKKVILVADALFVVGALWQAVTASVMGMIAGRSVVGLAVGAASLVVPLYISELSPSPFRGRLVTLSILFVTGGQMVAYVIGWMLSTKVEGWRWMVGIGAFPALSQFAMLVFLPETPRWLVKANRKEDAKVVLGKVYGKHSAALKMVDGILRAIEREVMEEEEAMSKRRGHDYPRKGSWSWLTGLRDAWAELFAVGGNRRALTIACMLQGFQQLCGFNSLMYFSATIFALVGFNAPTLASLSIAITNFLLTVVAFILIDRVGRRRILLLSIPVMIAGLVLCAIVFNFIHLPNLHDAAEAEIEAGNGTTFWAFLILLSMVVYVCGYAVGMGPVPWQQSELFPLSVRSLGSGLATATNWGSNFIVGLTFLPMMEVLTPVWTFAVYAGVCVVGWWCVWRIYPETMGLGLEEVGGLLADGWGVRESRRKFGVRC